MIMFLWNCREIISESYTLYRIQFARRLSRKQRRILACFNGVFTLMFCESSSKIFNFSRTAEKKNQLCEVTTLPFQGRLPIARISCLIVNKCRCKNGKQINLKRNKYQANILQNRFELCGSKLQKIQCKTVSVKFRFYVMFTVLIQ